VCMRLSSLLHSPGLQSFRHASQAPQYPPNPRSFYNQWILPDSSIP
jgi:hypothetical protein